MKFIYSAIILLVNFYEASAQFKEIDELDKYTIQYRYKDADLKTTDVVCLSRNTMDTVIHLKFNSLGELDGMQLLDGERHIFTNGNPIELKISMPMYSKDLKSIPYKFTLEGTYTDGKFHVYKKIERHIHYVNDMLSNYLEQFNGFYYPIYRSEVVSFAYVLCGTLTVENGDVVEIENIKPDYHKFFKYKNNELAEVVSYQYYENSSVRFYLENDNWLMDDWFKSDLIYFLKGGSYYMYGNRGFEYHTMELRPDATRVSDSNNKLISGISNYRVYNYNTLRNAFNRFF